MWALFGKHGVGVIIMDIKLSDYCEYIHVHVHVYVVLGKRNCSIKEAKLRISWQGKLGRERGELERD